MATRKQTQKYRLVGLVVGIDAKPGDVIELSEEQAQSRIYRTRVHPVDTGDDKPSRADARRIGELEGQVADLQAQLKQAQEGKQGGKQSELVVNPADKQ